MSNLDYLLRLLLQLAVILAACRLAGMIGRRIGQAQVVCEMVMGVLLGPSLLGVLAPTVQQWLFPHTLTVGKQITTHPSMIVLYTIGQVGVTLYMFLVGLEFDAHLLLGRGKHAGIISMSGILVPFLLGGALALWMMPQGLLFGATISPLIAALFLGTSLSITAFPVLARILQEQQLIHTRLGTLVLAIASVDDISAWCLLALILAFMHHSAVLAAVTIGGAGLYVAFMLTFGRRLLSLLGPLADSRTGITTELLSVVLLVVLLCSWVTTQIGIYEIFGAFIAGVAMPRGRFAEEVRHRLEGLTTSLLLPIFFLYSGLNTQLRLINTPLLWLLAGGIILVAILGKGVACALGARLVGISWREAATIGSLMNARGLIELILLNIGLEQGVLTPTLFTILVLMALTTTLMTSPLLRHIYRHVVHPTELVTDRAIRPLPSARRESGPTQ